MNLFNTTEKNIPQIDELTPTIAQGIYNLLKNGVKPNNIFFEGYRHYHIDQVLAEIEKLTQDFNFIAYDNLILESGETNVDENGELIIKEPVYFIAKTKDDLLSKLTNEYLNESLFIDDYITSLGYANYNEFRTEIGK